MFLWTFLSFSFETRLDFSSTLKFLQSLRTFIVSFLFQSSATFSLDLINKYVLRIEEQIFHSSTGWGMSCAGLGILKSMQRKWFPRRNFKFPPSLSRTIQSLHFNSEKVIDQYQETILYKHFNLEQNWIRIKFLYSVDCNKFNINWSNSPSRSLREVFSFLEQNFIDRIAF